MTLKDIKSKDVKFANILHAVGEFGKFQRRLVALTFIPGILLAFVHAEHLVFTDQEHYCNTSWILAVGPNLSESEQLNLTLPRAPSGGFQMCLMYLPVPWDLGSIIQFGLNHTATCQHGWIYPKAKTRSLISEFDLVCGKEPDEESLKSISMAGFLTGSLIFGFINHMLGHYPAILMSLLGLTIFNFGTAFVRSLHQYFFFRFLASQAVMGYTISSVCLANECLVDNHRAHAIFLEHCFISVGVLFLTGLSYSLPHWRLLFLVGGAPVFLFIFYIWILPESPRWLMMKRKVKEAKQILCYAASVNKRTIPYNLLNELQLPGKMMTEASVLDFYYNRHLRKVILVVGCIWFTVSYTYFTLTFKMRDFGVNVHFRQAVSGIMKVPVQLCCIVIFEHKGRKWSLIVTLTQTIILCCLLLIFQAELLPTVLRATGLGLVILASSGGVMSCETIIYQILSLQPIVLCCILSCVALYFSFLLPETQDQPLSDSLEYFSKASLQKETTQNFEDTFGKRNSDIMEMMMAEDSASDDVSEEAAKNTVLNANILRLDADISSTPAVEPSAPEEAHGQAP
ncbi:solute carrier family 22 member 14 isoform X2 [Fukomys damarensis]|uniref:solute carrier family 22 member 14 isoform X2 n=1 Tax=Fukomys damarensis TaxID=885580 RepID=UPI00053FB7AC|nr:solute carrier family 22 member 14 isoform X2 [Fukomys damarensis]